jgi:hypothetical protein
MLALKSWVYGKISTDSALLALIGDTSHITDAWPEVFTVFPMVIYQDDNQQDWEWADNTPSGTSARIRVDIFTKLDGPTTTQIGMEVARIFRTNLFNCGTNGEVPDPTEGVRHRVMRFNRAFFPGQII